MKTLILAGLLLFACGFPLRAAEAVVLYTSPQKQGTGDALTPENAAAFRDLAFWKQVNTRLAEAPVTVKLAAGSYLVSYSKKRRAVVSINQVGNPENRLTIQGAPDGASVFSRDPNDSRDLNDNRNWPNLITFRNCRNITVENLHFTGEGPVGYALAFRDTQDVTVRHCQWKDMPGIAYAASGASGRECRNITWEENVFDTIGHDSHAHMIYNSFYCSELTVRRNFFRDSSGDYVRFRNGVNGIVIEENRFEDTGRFPAFPFVSFPLFIDHDEEEHYEYFSQKITLRNNEFTYRKPGARSTMLLFHHSGYNAPGKSFLISKKEAKELQTVSVQEGRDILRERFGIDPENVVISGNRTKGCRRNIVYESFPVFGVEKKFPAAEYRVSIVLDRFFAMK